MQLMNSAMELFVDVGYEEVTLAQIAEHAEIHVQTLYKHFKNKTILATAYFDLYFDMVIDILQYFDPDEALFPQINQATTQLLSTITSNDTALPMFRMIHANEELLAHTQHQVRKFEDRLTILLQTHRARSYDELEARLLAAVLVASYRDAHFSWIHSDGKVNSVQKFAEYFRLIEERFSA